MSDALTETLHRVWGFSTFRPLQREAMDAILASRDSVVVLPTGGGKSLCFQAPAVATDRGLALVISPLISLMKDQVDGLRVDGVAASYLNSTLIPRQRDEVIASVRSGRCRLLYVSPERIAGEGSQPLRRLLAQSDLRFIAIDEAHPAGVPTARSAARGFSWRLAARFHRDGNRARPRGHRR